MRLRRTGSDAVLFSKSKHQGRNFTGGPKKGGFEKRKGKCFKCKKLGHWARDCPESKTEEFAAILVKDRQGSAKSVPSETGESAISKSTMINSNSKEKFILRRNLWDECGMKNFQYNKILSMQLYHEYFI